ncbi:MAG: hypothetical protein M1821_001848 [Bathelium mastoideum]|nr:MAG: hypothetical protein M1821_001848 [Bathelium mastoideum]
MSPGAPVTGDTGPGGEHGSTSQDVLDTDLFTHAHPTEEERLSDGGKKQESIRRTEEAVNGWAEKDLKNILEPKQRILSSERLKPNVEAILDFEKQQLPISPEQTALNGDASRDLEKQEADASSKTSARKEEIAIIDESQDSNIVDWDGPDDPQNPMNWTAGRRWGMIAVVSAITFLTPLGSSMFAPGVPLVMQDFHSTNELLAGFVVSVYVLGFACGPLVIAPLSEMWGRNPLYHSCNCLFLIFNIACAVSSNLNMLIGFRFLTGCVGSAPLTLGGGTIADVISREHRGTAMSAWLLGPTVGPVVGPIAGGFLSQAAGWRWTFWVLAIASGVFTAMAFLLLKETSGIAILAAKTRRLRRETGNPQLRSRLDNGLSPRDLFLRSIVRPTKMLTRSPIVFLLSLYVAVVYAYLYLLFTTFTPVYEEQYGFSLGTAGLSYLGIGVGAFSGQFVNTHFGNRLVRGRMERGTFKPEHRLPLMVPGAICVPVGLFWYGWSAQARTHWIVPIIGTGFVGFGLLLTFMPATTYLVDVFTIYAASAMAANTVLRSVFAAILPLAGQDMYAALGLGWGNSLLGFIALALMPTPLIFMRYGEKIRTKYPVKL